MQIRNAGKTIHHIRKYLGQTQEKFSEGIYEATSLSRIESGIADVSEKTFHRFMEKAGIPFITYPEFHSKEDFLAFRCLQNLLYALNSWKLYDCLPELRTLSDINYGDNVHNYYLTLIYLSELMLKSGHSNINKMMDNLNEALIGLCPNVCLEHATDMYLSNHVIHCIILLSECYISLGNIEQALTLTSMIISYLERCDFSSEEKNHLSEKNSLARIKVELSLCEFSLAAEHCQALCTRLQYNHNDTCLCETFFLWAVADIRLGNIQDGIFHFDSAFYSSHAFQNGYSNRILKYIITSFPDINLNIDNYPFQEPEFFYAKLYNIIDCRLTSFVKPQFASKTHYLLGDIIKDLRNDNKLTQLQLCHGLCSKSKLSKIESNQMHPGCFLLEALLQRLGIQSNLFCTFSSKKEFLISELKNKILIDLKSYNQTYDSNMVNTFVSLLSPNDVISQQWFLLITNLCDSTSTSYLSNLNHALRLTVPNFKTDCIFNFVFTYNELTLITNSYSFLSQSKNTLAESIYGFEQLLQYYELISPDGIIFSKNYSLIISCYIAALYRAAYYQKLTDVFHRYHNHFGLLDRRQFARIFFYYCQSLFELKQYQEGILAAHSTIALNRIVENNSNIDRLKQYLKSDFDITI